MENKSVGYLLLGISLLIVLVILIFNNAIKDFGERECPVVQAGDFCPTHSAVNEQTYLSLVIVGILILISLFLILSKPNETVIIKKIKEKARKKEYDLSELKSEEKQIFDIIRENKAIFQADLIDRTGMGKAKVTRILDRLEGNGLVERKRRGMTNIVILKE